MVAFCGIFPASVLGEGLDTPSTRGIAPGGIVQARYLAAIAQVPADWRSIADVRPEPHALRIFGGQRGSTIEIPVSGLLKFTEGENDR
jgi:hypothetical protein